MEGRRGLTMIEMLVTLAVLMAIAALALPRFGVLLGPAQVDSAAAQIGAAVQTGRQIARDTGKPASVTAAAGARGVSLSIETANGGRGRQLGALPAEFSIVADPDASEAERNTRDEPKPARIAVCLPDGTVDGTGIVLMVRGREFGVTVSRWTGAVTVAELVKPPEGEPSSPESPAQSPTGGPP